MKLFQIEEPDGVPVEAEGPGAAVGMDLSPRHGAAVAMAAGGNAEILPGRDGDWRLPAAAAWRPDGRLDDTALRALVLALRERAEKALARPVTHVVFAVDVADEVARGMLTEAAEAAGLGVLRHLDRGAAAALAAGASPADASALGAAIAAEDAAALMQPR